MDASTVLSSLDGKDAAVWGTGGLVGAFALLKFWKSLRETWLDQKVDQRLNEAAERSAKRVVMLEDDMEKLQKQLYDQAQTIGELKGELKAAKAEVTSLTEGKAGWKERCERSEARAAELDRAVDMLTVHNVTLALKLDVANGKMKAENLVDTPLGALPDVVMQKIEAVKTGSLTNLIQGGVAKPE